MPRSTAERPNGRRTLSGSGAGSVGSRRCEMEASSPSSSAIGLAGVRGAGSGVCPNPGTDRATRRSLSRKAATIALATATPCVSRCKRGGAVTISWPAGGGRFGRSTGGAASVGAAAGIGARYCWSVAPPLRAVRHCWCWRYPRWRRRPLARQGQRGTPIKPGTRRWCRSGRRCRQTARGSGCLAVACERGMRICWCRRKLPTAWPGRVRSSAAAVSIAGFHHRRCSVFGAASCWPPRWRQPRAGRKCWRHLAIAVVPAPPLAVCT